jgi:trigger factor
LKASLSQPKSWQRVFDIEIPEEELNAVVAEKQGTYGKRVRLPGFRKGKVPAKILQSRFGPAIRAEAIEELIQKSYEEACQRDNVVPICGARVSDLKADKAGPVRFRVETEVDPEIEVKGYKKLKVSPNPRKIKSSDIDEAVESLRERLAEVNDVDRPAATGDLVSIEYITVEIDGQQRSDFKSPQYPIELGGARLKDFDKGLQGRSAGETVEIKVKFPKDYAERSVAGKTGRFEVKILKVQEKRLPEIDEAFLKKVGDFADVEALRDRVRTDLEAKEMERAKNEAYSKAMDVLIKNNDFEVPASRVESYIDHMVEETAKYRRGGQPLPTREEIASRYRESGIRAIKRYRIIDYIARQEDIKATQEEVDGRIEHMARVYNQPFDQLKQALRKDGTTNRIRADIREQKTLDFLVGALDPSA